MGRSNYSDDIDNWKLIRWRGQVASAIKGNRGQRFLKDLITALEAMPAKRLIRNALQDNRGEVCAIGALCIQKGLDMSKLMNPPDPENSDAVAIALDIAPQLAQEVFFENDERGWGVTPEQRWTRMHEWALDRVKELV